MSEVFTGSLAARIAALVRPLLIRHGGSGLIAPEDDLRGAGLTSLDLVNLTLAVEAEFDVFIPAEKMTPAYFRSVAAIEALLGELEPA